MTDLTAENGQLGDLLRPSHWEELPEPWARTPQSGSRDMLPEGTVVVSADSHWSISEDIFYENFPPSLREYAPRVVFDGGVHDLGGVSDRFFGPPDLEQNRRAVEPFERRPGCYQIGPRLQDMDAEGIDKEIVFPNALLGSFRGGSRNLPTDEVARMFFRVYNDYLVEVGRQAPGRFHGVGIPCVWNPDYAAESVEHIAELGLKTMMIPQIPRDLDGKTLDYTDPEMDTLWSAIEASGLPVCFHVGEGPAFMGPGSARASGLYNLTTMFRKNFAELVFLGILDRHPNLKVVFAEGGINWVAGALLEGARFYAGIRMDDPQIQHHPSYYWHNNCYATFMTDPIGLRLLDQIGADRVMYGADYPHTESTLGYGWDAMTAVVEATTPDLARRILGETAMEVFSL